jgi:protocatechuate 3,4-dioxygenase beta subunit
VRDTAGKPIVGLTLMIAPADRADAPPPEGIWFSTVTDAQGEYELQDLEPGPYEACVSVATAQDIVHVGSFEVPPGSAAEHHFVLARAAIRGTVINAQTRAPLEQSVVLLLRQTASGEEFAGRVLGDVHGRFAFVHVTPGVYSVFAYALRGELGQECVERLTLGDGEVLEGLVFELGPGATLELSAVDDAGAPVAGALVKFHDASGREVSFSDVEVTDERGDYEARGMKPGRWTLTLTAAGAERTLELAAGERPQLRVELRRTR